MKTTKFETRKWRAEKSNLVLGEACPSVLHPVEAYKCESFSAGRKVVLSGRDVGFQTDIDISWLPLAADTYDISPDIRDYIIVPVPLVTSDIPNRNLQAFTFDELTYFDPMMGMSGYRTFVGKPTFVDHNNSDPLQAKGINLDASITAIPKYNVWKVNVLSAFDRTKDSTLCRDIVNGERRAYSMGCLVSFFECSICGHRSKKQNASECEHMALGKGSIIDGKLVYEICRGINFIENSSLTGNDPADVTAFSSGPIL